MQELVPWLWIIAIAVVFWLLIIRPASRRQKDLVRLQSSLAVGDHVILTSGVYATIDAIADDHLMVRIAPEVTIKVARAAVGSVLRDDAVAPADDVAPLEQPADEATDTERRDDPEER